ncbi:MULTISPECIES: flotillin family protein [Flavobacteriaceae]|uniref:Flotillin family protein n=2 Tax=Flavobacteriaceae TaxID=49546 RepID=A0A4Y8AS24_9FLAO|nr:flotillin family protein [Gramella jeungdoensis]GGK39372.1 flotillin [Lutibacter litoralis]
MNLLPFLVPLQSGLTGVYLTAAIIIIPVVFLFAMIRRYKRCPSDRILVVYGKTGGGLSAKCVHGGAAFIWPIIQDYEFLDLTPMSIEVNLTNALSKQNIRVNVPSRFTIGISTEPSVMQNAAERLLGLQLDAVQDLAQEIIFGQLRLVVASMDIEEINSDRDQFLSHITHSVEAELKKVGLKLINVNITDIHDESGYIQALGKEAAAKAINEAKVSVAQKVRDGSIGEANAMQDQRIQVAAADANAVHGENTAKVQVANSNADRRSREAEAERIANASEKVQAAKALEEAYAAEKIAEDARAKRKEAEQGADIIVPARIDKQKIEIDAEAEAEQIRRIAKGEADAIFMKKEAEAKGMYEILTKQALGLEQIVKAAGDDAKDAVLLLVADKLPELVKTQAEAIKNIKIDKVTVWENGGGKDGKTSTSNFISGMYKSVPPLQEMFNMAGMQLPNYLKGEEVENTSEKPTEDTTPKE